MTDTAEGQQFLTFNLDDLNIGEITFLELTLNRELREFVAPDIITFQDVVATFRYHRGAIDPDTGQPEPAPRINVPMGPILQCCGLMQLRKTNPEATWEQAGELRLEQEAVTTPVDPTKLLAEASAAAQIPLDPLETIQRSMDQSHDPTLAPPPPLTTPSSVDTSIGS